MRIVRITPDLVQFNTGDVITYHHSPDCCEFNYADFKQIDDIALRTSFESPLSFEKVGTTGFRFGNQPLKMFFVPCYSEQNGYYSNDLDIFYNGKKVFNLQNLKIV